mgnify:CR=1 FL=1
MSACVGGSMSRRVEVQETRVGEIFDESRCNYVVVASMENGLRASGLPRFVVASYIPSSFSKGVCSLREDTIALSICGVGGVGGRGRGEGQGCGRKTFDRGRRNTRR